MPEHPAAGLGHLGLGARPQPRRRPPVSVGIKLKMSIYKDVGVENSDSKNRRLVPKLQTFAVSAPNEEGSSHSGEEPGDNTSTVLAPVIH